MAAKIAELTIWILALITVGSIAAYLLKRLVSNDGSVVKDFNKHVTAAEELDAELERLKKERIRGTVSFQDALKRHRARFGVPRRPSDGSDAS